MVVAHREVHHVNILPRTVAAAATEHIQLLTAADDPVHTTISTGAATATCDRNSKITGIKIGVTIVGTGGAGDPIPVAILLWKDAQYGGGADPTTANDVLQPSTTSTLTIIKKNACMHRRFYLSSSSDKATIWLRVPRRLRVMREGESLTLTVTNMEAATDDIEWMAHGRIWTQS